MYRFIQLAVTVVITHLVHWEALHLVKTKNATQN